MNNVIRRNGLCSLQQLHLLLNIEPSVVRFWGMSLPSHRVSNSLLKNECKFSLLSFEKEVRQTAAQNLSGFFGRTVPLETVSPLRITLPVKIGRTSESVFAPDSKARGSVHNNYSHVESFVKASQIFSELPMGVNVDHSLSINESGQADPINFGRHVVELLKDSDMTRES